MGLKDSSGDVDYMETLLETFPGFAVFPSSEALLLNAMRKGAAGLISATANINVAGIREVFDGSQRPDALSLQSKASLIREAVAPFGWIPGVKAVLAAREGTPDWARVRPPLDELSDQQKTDLLTAVREITGE